MEPNTVLIVDDNRIHSYALGKHLAASGFEVVYAHLGSVAIQLAVAHHPDAILLDINLPDTTGFGICRQLKADPRTKSIPVVFHSATHDTGSARSEALDVGAVSFLSYPINVEHLENVIKGAIAHAQTESRHS